MEEIKMIGMMLLFMVLIAGSIISIVFGCMYVSNQYEESAQLRNIQCKQLGGVWTYENYKWYCK